MTIQQQLQNIYLDYVNNYLTLEVMAEHNNIEPSELALLVEMGKRINHKNSMLY